MALTRILPGQQEHYSGQDVSFLPPARLRLGFGRDSGIGQVLAHLEHFLEFRGLMKIEIRAELGAPLSQLGVIVIGEHDDDEGRVLFPGRRQQIGAVLPAEIEVEEQHVRPDLPDQGCAGWEIGRLPRDLDSIQRREKGGETLTQQSGIIHQHDPN